MIGGRGTSVGDVMGILVVVVVVIEDCVDEFGIMATSLGSSQLQGSNLGHLIYGTVYNLYFATLTLSI